MSNRMIEEIRRRCGLSAVLTLLISSGCGVLLVEGPPQIHPGQPVFCTESMALPRLDATLGAVNAVGAVAVANQRSGDLTDEERTFVFVTSAVYAAAQFTSWAVGRSKVLNCRRAKLEYQRMRLPALLLPDTTIRGKQLYRQRTEVQLPGQALRKDDPAGPTADSGG